MSDNNLKSIVVFISGNGSNLQSIIDNIKNNTIKNAKIDLVVSNRSKAYGLTRAKENNIPTKILTLKKYKDENKTRLEYDLDLANLVLNNIKPDLIVLAGFMHILSSEFLDKFPNTNLINLHPALPGQFDGAEAIPRAFNAFKKGEIKHTGVMVHKVIKDVDRGEVICFEEVEIKNDDKLEHLEDRIHEVEHKLLITGINLILEDKKL